MHASLLLHLALLVHAFLSHPSISPHSPHPNSPLRPVLMFSRAATSVAPRLAARATLRPASSIRAFSSEKAEDVVVEEEVSSADLSGRLGIGQILFACTNMSTKISPSPPCPAHSDQAPKIPKRVGGVGNIFDVAKQLNPDLPANLPEVATLDRAHDKQGYRVVQIRQMGRGSMTSSVGAGRNWVVRFSNTAESWSNGEEVRFMSVWRPQRPHKQQQQQQ